MPNKRPSPLWLENTWTRDQTFPAGGILLGGYRIRIIEELVDGQTRMVLQVTPPGGTMRELTSIRYE
jgi:hypothetical protein